MIITTPFSDFLTSHTCGCRESNLGPSGANGDQVGNNRELRDLFGEEGGGVPHGRADKEELFASKLDGRTVRFHRNLPGQEGSGLCQKDLHEGLDIGHAVLYSRGLPEDHSYEQGAIPKMVTHRDFRWMNEDKSQTQLTLHNTKMMP